MTRKKTLPKPPKATTHAKLSASSSHRWMVCTGSVALCEGIPDTTTSHAAEGTYAHHILATCLQEPDKYKPADWLDVTDNIDGHEMTCEQDMVDAVAEALGIVNANVESGDKLYVEQDFTPKLKELHPDFGGMSDVCILKPKQKLLLVFDYKHGRGVKVGAENNRQLKYYALGALLTCEHPVSRVRLGIIQPRYNDGGDTLETWEFDAVNLIDFSADLIEAANATKSFDAPLVPGLSQCKFCPAANKCPELEKAQHQLISAEFDVVEQGGSLTPDALAEALQIIPMVEERISQLRELAYQEGLKGNLPPGFKIVEKWSRRHWKDEDEARQQLDMFLGDDALTEPKLKSPAQIEKLLKGDSRKLVSELAESVSSGYTLVPESDKRQPAKLAAPDDFEDITGE